MKRILIAILVCQAFVFTATAQNPKLDSLQNLLQKHKSQDTIRVNLLIEIVYELPDSDLDKTLQYAQEAGELADKLGFTKGKAESLKLIGFYYNAKSDYSQALTYYQKALQMYKKLGNKKGMVVSLNNMGVIYQNRGDYSQALEYYQKALKINEEFGYKNGMLLNLINIGDTYEKQGDYSKSLRYHQQSLQLSKEVGDESRTSLSLNNIGNIYEKQGDYQKALEYYQKALQINVEIGSKEGMCLNYIGFGAVYLKTNQYVQALTYTFKALEIAKELGLLEYLKEINKQLSQIYAATNNYQKAYQYHVAFKQLNDSLFNEANVKKITGLEYQYKYEKEKQATALEQAKKDAVQAEKAKRERTIRNGLSIGFVLVLILALVILRSLMQKRKTNRILENQKKLIENTNEELNSTLILVNEQKSEIEKQKAVVEDVNKHMTDSINYASRIQKAILPLQSTFDTLLPEHFIFFKPRDIVSGDFYYLREIDHKIILTAVDCTGHGVPGAFMSLIGYSGLNILTVITRITSASEILKEMHRGIRQILRQKETNTNDGMDMALVVIDKKQKTLTFAGAKNPLIYVQNGELHQIKGDIFGIGGEQREMERNYTSHQVDISEPTTFYLFSDGYKDQFGGPIGKKFMSNRFRDLLFEIHSKPMEEQQAILQSTLVDWMGNEKQTDDILVIGVKV